MNNVEQIMNVASEPSEPEGNITSNKGKNTRHKSSTKVKYRNWIIGLIVSFIPILALPLSKIYIGHSASQVLFEAFCGAEIIFIGISLSISSLNDFIVQETGENKQGWILVNIVLIVLGAMIYGVTVITENNPQSETQSFNYVLAFGINISFLIIIFLLGSARYIKEIWKEK